MSTAVYALNTLFLVIVGTGMLAVPAKFFPKADELGRALTQAIGIGDLTVAAITGLALATRTSVASGALGALVIFHLGLTVVLALNRRTEFYKLPVLITHGAFGVAFAVLLAPALGL